jgi:hypothetical protein
LKTSGNAGRANWQGQYTKEKTIWLIAGLYSCIRDFICGRLLNPGVWTGRISQKYRWTFHFEADAETGERICVHRMIGGHEEVYRKP